MVCADVSDVGQASNPALKDSRFCQAEMLGNAFLGRRREFQVLIKP